MLARWSGTLSLILSRIQRFAQTVLDKAHSRPTTDTTQSRPITDQLETRLIADQLQTRLTADQPQTNYFKRTCSRGTSAPSALGVLNDYALYKSTHSRTHSLTHNTVIDKSVLSLVNSAVNMTLPASAAERRAAWAPGRRCRSISLVCTAFSSKPAARRCCSRMTDGQTDGHLAVLYTLLCVLCG